MFKNIIFLSIIGFSLLFSCTKKHREKKIVGNYRVASYQFIEHSEDNNVIIDHSEILIGSIINGSMMTNNNGSTTVQSYTINHIVFEYDFNVDGTWTKRWTGTTKSQQDNGTQETLKSTLNSNQTTTGTWLFNQLIITIDLTTLKIATIDTNIIETVSTIFGNPFTATDTIIDVNDVIFQPGEFITEYTLDELKKTEMSITQKNDSGCDNSFCTNTKLETIFLKEK